MFRAIIILLVLISSMISLFASENLKWVKGYGGGESKHFALSPDGRYFVTSGVNIINIYDVNTGNLAKVYSNNHYESAKIFFTPDNRLVDFSSAQRPVWNLQTDTVEKDFGTFLNIDGREFFISSYSEMSTDGKYLAFLGCWKDNQTVYKIIIWDFSEDKLITTLNTSISSNMVWMSDDIEFSPDNKCLAVYIGDLSIWDALTGQVIKRIKTPLFTNIKYTKDGKYIGGITKTYDQNTGKPRFFVEIRNTADYNVVKSFECYSLPKFDANCSFSPGSDYVAFQGKEGGNIEVREIASGNLVNKFNTIGLRYPDCVFFTPDNQSIIAAKIGEGFSDKYNFRTGQLETSFSIAGDGVNRLVFSPDNKWLAMYTADGYLKIIDVETGGVVKFTGTGLNILESGYSSGASIAFSPGSDKLAVTTRDKNIFTWNLITDEKKLIKDHSDTTNSVAFSPDGRFLASTSTDKSIIIHDVSTYSVFKKFTNDKIIIRVSFSTDGKHIIGIGVSPADWYDIQQIVWNIDDGSFKATNIPPEGRPLTEKSPSGFSADGRFFARCNYVWDIENKELLLVNYGAGCYDVALSAKGEYLADFTGTNRETHDFSIIKIPYGEVMSHHNIFDEVKYTKHNAWDELSHSNPWKVAISNDNKYVAMASMDKNVYLWKFLDGTEVEETMRPDQAGCTASVRPNPAQDFATLRYELPESGIVRITLFDALANDLGNVFSQWQEKGINILEIKLNNMQSGVYFYRIQINNSCQVVPFVIN